MTVQGLSTSRRTDRTNATGRPGPLRLGGRNDDETLSAALAALDARIRHVTASRRSGSAFCFLGLAVILGIAADVLFVLPMAARWLTWALLAVVATVSLGAIVRTFLTHGRDSLALAALVEAADPDLEAGEMLTAAVGLTSGPHARTKQGAGSVSLVNEIKARAAALALRINPQRVIPGRHAFARLAIGAAILSLIAAPSLFEGVYRTYFVRLLAPWTNLRRPGGYRVWVEPEHRKAIRGAPLLLEATVAPRFATLAKTPGEAWIQWTIDREGSAASEPRRAEMKHVAGQPSGANVATSESAGGRSPTWRFAAGLPSPRESFRFRVVVSRDSRLEASPRFSIPIDFSTTVTPWYRVELVDAAAIASVSAIIEPPRYTGRPAVTVAADRIEALQDSRIALHVQSQSTIREVRVEFEPEPAATSQRDSRMIRAEVEPDQRSAIVDLPSERSGSFALSLVDEHGLESLPEIPRRLLIHTDAPPELKVEDLETEPIATGAKAGLDVRADEVVRFAVSAHDDVAVATAEILTEIVRAESAGDKASGRADQSRAGGLGSGTTQSTPIPLNGLGTPEAQGQATLPLAELELRAGDRLTYRVRIADNRPAPRGPNVVVSSTRTLVVARRVRPLEERRSEARRAGLQRSLDALKQLAAGLRQAAEQLRYAADAMLRGNGRWDEERQRELSRRSEQARELVDKIRLFARNADEDGERQPLAEQAEQIAEDPAPKGRDSLDQARQAGEGTKPDPVRRLDSLRQADNHLAAVAARLERLQTELDRLAIMPPSAGMSAKGQERRNLKAGSGPRSGRPGAAAPRPGQASASGKLASQPARGAGPGPGDDEVVPGTDSAGAAIAPASGRNWGELPGHLRTQLLQASPATYREAYSRQIKRYFRILAEPTPRNNNGATR